MKSVSSTLSQFAEPKHTRRPAVIVSNDGANTTAERLGRGVLTVVPVTSSITHVYPFQVLLPACETGLRDDSKASRTNPRRDVRHVGTRLGTVPSSLMADLDDALRLHLAL